MFFNRSFLIIKNFTIIMSNYFYVVGSNGDISSPLEENDDSDRWLVKLADSTLNVDTHIPRIPPLEDKQDVERFGQALSKHYSNISIQPLSVREYEKAKKSSYDRFKSDFDRFKSADGSFTTENRERNFEHQLKQLEKSIEVRVRMDKIGETGFYPV